MLTAQQHFQTAFFFKVALVGHPAFPYGHPWYLHQGHLIGKRDADAAPKADARYGGFYFQRWGGGYNGYYGPYGTYGYLG